MEKIIQYIGLDVHKRKKRGQVLKYKVCQKTDNSRLDPFYTGRGKYNKTQKQLTSIKAMCGFPLVNDFRKMLCESENVSLPTLLEKLL